MCDFSVISKGKKIEDKYHLTILGYFQGYGICKGDTGWLYLARLDKHLKPIQLWSGDIPDIYETFKCYFDNSKVEFKLLELM